LTPTVAWVQFLQVLYQYILFSPATVKPFYYICVLFIFPF